MIKSLLKGKKICNHCNKIKDLSDFNIQDYARERLDWLCRVCRSKYRRERYLINREKEIQNAKKWKELHKNIEPFFKKNRTKINKIKNKTYKIKRELKRIRLINSNLRNEAETLKFCFQEIKEKIEWKGARTCKKCGKYKKKSEFKERIVNSRGRIAWFFELCNPCIVIEKREAKRINQWHYRRYKLREEIGGRIKKNEEIYSILKELKLSLTQKEKEYETL